MSKAEEAAMKAYPEEIYEDDSWTDDLNKYQREGFIKGYEQAEKDLALTWEDVLQIRGIMAQMCVEPDEHPEWLLTDEAYYEEVLRRFKEAKQ